MGPWGDAIMHELLPFIEAKFRGIGEGWARFCYGGSTGGWESLAVQLMYPDDFNVGLSSGASPALLLTGTDAPIDGMASTEQLLCVNPLCYHMRY